MDSEVQNNMWIRCILLVAVELSAIIFNSASAAQECYRYRSCRECIRQPQCTWCSQNDFPDLKRCFNSKENDSDRPMCDESHETNPKGSVLIVENGVLGKSYDGREDSEIEDGEAAHFIQITPLRVNVTLRPNEEQTIIVTFKQSNNYPLDVYYLTDSSWSMRHDIVMVAKLGDEISRTMRSITKNFKLGCGMFVEKPLRPFDYYYEGCEQKEGVCRNSGHDFMHEFKHLLRLEANSTRFRDTMLGIKTRGNLDNPEAGLTALMQVMVCKEIGWRDNSRRLVIYSSDNDYHQAGDGKLVGVVRPNDGECHLDKDGFYTHSALLDYPSVSHINYMASKQNTIIIFAITNKKSQEIYVKLSEAIKGSSFVALENNSRNVVDAIKNVYNNITSFVELSDTSPDYIDVKYRTSCYESQPVDSQKCAGITVGKEVKFDVSIKLRKCPPADEPRTTSFEIKPSGMNESVIVNVEMICECPCEKEDIERNSRECNSAGAHQCGICECDDDHIGWRCECHRVNQNDGNTSKCMPQQTPADATQNTALECSGNGHCMCGMCECFDKQHVSGTYCECDDRSCRHKYNKPCSGHGICNCGDCECDSGWTHSSPDDPVCDCIVSKDSCFLTASSQAECSGHGSCVCGKCFCEEGFVGDYCQVPPRHYKLCKQIDACVECLAYGTGNKFQLGQLNNCSEDCSFKFSPGIDYINNEAIQCYANDVDGCRYQFYYYYEGMQLKVRAQEEKPQCEKINMSLYILTTTGTGLLIGILALIAWKLVTMTYDRMEYMKFMKEQERAKWDAGDNPLYKGPNMTVQNPMFQAES